MPMCGNVIEEAANTYERVCGRVCLKEIRPSQLIFSGELGPRRDVILLNAAAAFLVAGRAARLADGVNLAAVTIDAGLPRDLLARLRAAKAHAEVTVWSDEFLAEALRRRLRVHVKFNSGMGRLGVRETGAAALAAAAGPGLSGLMSHFATADEDDPSFFEGQLARFTALAAQLKTRFPSLTAHTANSAATMREPAAHFDMVRTGIAIYGLSPFGDDPTPRGLRPALRLCSYVAGIREVVPGESVGYGRRFIADRPARLAIVPIGYADGIARALTNRGDVLIAGRRCRITGTISMDQLTVLLPGDPRAVRPGDEVVFIGRSGAERILAEDVARLLDTINYEIACDVSPRVARRYDPA